jgi:hypothetical protein
VGRWNGPGGIARHVAIGVLLSAATACTEILATVSPIAVAGATDGRYAVDIGRTLALYIGIGAIYGAIFGGAFSLIAFARPNAARASVVGRGYAVATGTWVFLGAVAIRVVHGTRFLGAEAGPPSTIFIAAAALAVSVGYVVAVATPVRKLPPRFRRRRHHRRRGASARGRFDPSARSRVAGSARSRQSPPQRMAAEPARASMLPLTIDTLRADRIGRMEMTGERRLSTVWPGALFERAIAIVVHAPAVVTSRYPPIIRPRGS